MTAAAWDAAPDLRGVPAQCALAVASGDAIVADFLVEANARVEGTFPTCGPVKRVSASRDSFRCDLRAPDPPSAHAMQCPSDARKALQQRRGGGRRGQHGIRLYEGLARGGEIGGGPGIPTLHVG